MYFLFWWYLDGFYFYLGAFISVVCKYFTLRIYYLNDYMLVTNNILK